MRLSAENPKEGPLYGSLPYELRLEVKAHVHNLDRDMLELCTVAELIDDCAEAVRVYRGLRDDLAHWLAEQDKKRGTDEVR